ncbi:hypothetical protein ANCDUO_23903 [Ancylostoma duodenale]|uniref:Uncharacterized protein n=1 Tax=Ancylostoma duodenale TaxID=51022 RepID=A0A0C2FMG0_9BILA|nr:hypothetical protein ANCDUO_23903 [Ancylostoma duodenale]
MSVVCLSLYSLNSTVFQLISYLYLSSNGYFGDQLCELFFPGATRCFVSATKRGNEIAEAAIHFVQVLLDFFVLILSGVMCIAAIRISVMVRAPESSGNRKLESAIRILCSEKLAFHPISQTTLLIMSVVRFVEILTLLDYRGTGDDLTFAWKVHQTADFIALSSHFATAVLVIRLMGNAIADANADELRFNNPLTLEENGNYLQLRHQEES